MDQAEEQRIREDFITWSGGFPPESNEEIAMYVEVARPFDTAAGDVSRLLKQWMRANDAAGE